MQSGSQRKWWQMRRVRYPAAVLLVLVTATGAAIVRSNSSRVVVYNDSGASVAELTVTACGQSRTFQNVADRVSVRLKLAAQGGESDIAVATNGVLLWRGEYIEPRGGYRAIIRLGVGGQVEASTSISCWQGWLKNSTLDSN